MGRRIRGRVEKMVPGGEGLVRTEEGIVFVPGSCPGELVSAEIVEWKKGWGRSGPAEVLEATESRREPFCPIFHRCGGCSWQHMSYATQLECKESFVREALARQGGLDSRSIGDFQIVASPPLSYRSRIRPIILSNGRAAFRGTGNREPVVVEYCPVAVAGVNRFLAHPPERLNPRDEPVVFAQDDRYWVEGIDAEASAKIRQREFRFPPEAFFQSNLLIVDRVIDFVLAGADGLSEPEESLALDLYGGIGLFGAFLSRRFGHIIGVDRDPVVGEAWSRHVGSEDFSSTTLERWVKNNRSKAPDYVVVDPPRKGLSPSVRRSLIALKPRRLAYVSCNPVTQARDLRDLIAGGYRLISFGLFDFYPQTPHVETAAILESVE